MPVIIHLFTPFNFLEDRVYFNAIIRYSGKEEDYAIGRKVGFEKVWQVSSKETNGWYSQR